MKAGNLTKKKRVVTFIMFFLNGAKVINVCYSFKTRNTVSDKSDAVNISMGFWFKGPIILKTD